MLVYSTKKLSHNHILSPFYAYIVPTKVRELLE